MTKFARSLLSATGSPDSTSSSAPGPKIARSRLMSLFSAAVTRARTACMAVSKLSCAGADVCACAIEAPNIVRSASRVPRSCGIARQGWDSNGGIISELLAVEGALVECRRRQRWRGLDLPPSDLAEPQTPLRRGPLTRRQTQSVDCSRSAVLPDELPDSLAGPWPWPAAPAPHRCELVASRSKHHPNRGQLRNVRRPC